MRQEFINYLENLLEKVIKVSTNTPNTWNLVNVLGVDISCKYTAQLDSIELYMNTKFGNLLLMRNGYEQYYIGEELLFTHISYIKELSKKEKLVKDLPATSKYPSITIKGSVNIYL